MKISNKFSQLRTKTARFLSHLFFRVFVCIGLIVLLVWGVGGVDAATAAPADNRTVALRFAEAGWGTHSNWETVWDQLMSDDVVYHFNSMPMPVVGVDANKAFNTGLFVGFPALRQTIDDVVVDGDRVVYRATLQGKNTGEFLGVAPTGKSVNVSDVTWLRLADGKIAEWWYDCNLLEVMQQLGVVPN